MQVSGNQWMRAPKPLSKRPPRASVALITPPSAPRIEIWDVSALLFQIMISEGEVSSYEYWSLNNCYAITEQCRSLYRGVSSVKTPPPSPESVIWKHIFIVA